MRSSFDAVLHVHGQDAQKTPHPVPPTRRRPLLRRSLRHRGLRRRNHHHVPHPSADAGHRLEKAVLHQSRVCRNRHPPPPACKDTRSQSPRRPRHRTRCPLRQLRHRDGTLPARYPDALPLQERPGRRTPLPERTAGLSHCFKPAVISA